MILKLRDFFNIALIIVVMQLVILFTHEGIHLVQMNGRYTIYEACFVGYDSNGLGGWVIGAPHREYVDEINDPQIRFDMELQAQTVSSLLGLLVGAIMLYYLTGGKNERDIGVRMRKSG
jgi:hypothetical protein